MKIFILWLGPIANAWAQNLRAKGFEVQCWAPVAGFASRDRPTFERRTLGEYLGAGWRFLQGLMRIPIVLIRADAIHFVNGTTLVRTFAPYGFKGSNSNLAFVRALLSAIAQILQQIEFLAYRLFRIQIVMSWIGDDLRQGDALADQPVSLLLNNEYNYWPESDKHKRQNAIFLDSQGVTSFVHEAGLVPMHPTVNEFTPLPFVLKEDELQRLPTIALNTRSMYRILHAPSANDFKGTVFVQRAMAELSAKGLKFEYEEISGRSRSEVLAGVVRADIVVDQLLCGWYGAFALEAMCLRKPVISYIRESDLAYVPQELAKDLSVISAGPHELANVCEVLLGKTRKELRDLGEANYAYAMKWHGLDQGLSKFIEAYKGG